jgi:hypothetical protein
LFAAHRSGLLEQVGLWYFRRQARMEKARGARITAVLGDDDKMLRAMRRVTRQGAIICFIIGGISAGGSVCTWIAADGNTLLVKFARVTGVTLILTTIEFFVLFWVALWTVFCISRITGHSSVGDEKVAGLAARIPNMLARAALEIPDPVFKFLGINPLARVSRRKLLLIGLLYKLKIVGSNVVIKLFLRRVAGKSILRISVAYVSVIITGMWNALVLIKVMREARLRLFGHLLASHLVANTLTSEKLAALSPLAREGCLRAVANSVVFTQHNHPNMMLLLMRLAEKTSTGQEERLDDWERFLSVLKQISEPERFFVLDLFAVATAFDGRISRLEKQMSGLAFGEHTQVYLERVQRLTKMMRSGRLNEAIACCHVDFQPG